MKLFSRKPKCYGNMKLYRNCNLCKLENKCREKTNKHIKGTLVKYTNKSLPKPPRRK